MNEEEELKRHQELKVVEKTNTDIPIYCDNTVFTKMKGNGYIELSGYGPFRRLALVQEA